MIELIRAAGAADIWHREVREGKRKVSDHDQLSWAACLEARADEEAAEGLISSANEDRVEAAERLLMHFSEAQAA